MHVLLLPVELHLVWNGDLLARTLGLGEEWLYMYSYRRRTSGVMANLHMKKENKNEKKSDFSLLKISDKVSHKEPSSMG